MERELWAMLPKGYSLHAARMRMRHVTPEELARMDEDSVRAAEELADAQVAAIAYGCTIAIMCREPGYERQAQARLEDASGVPVILSATAVLDALRELGMRRVAVAFLRQYGIAVVDNKNLNIAENVVVGEQSEEVTYELVRRLDLRGADGVLISCAQLPSAGVIERLEREFDLPVISTNTATLWALFRRLGRPLAVRGYGRLLAGELRAA
jgi:maleate isomerase